GGTAPLVAVLGKACARPACSGGGTSPLMAVLGKACARPTPLVLTCSVGDSEELLLIEVAADRVNELVLFPNQSLHHPGVVGDQYTRVAVDCLGCGGRVLGRHRDHQAARGQRVADGLDLGDQVGV